MDQNPRIKLYIKIQNLQTPNSKSYNLLLSEAQKVVVRLETTAFHDRETEKESTLERSEGLGNESLCSLTLRLSAEKHES